MKGTFQITKVKGIPVCVHWSFTFVFLWVFLAAYSRDNGVDWAIFKVNLLSVITLFSIVIFHELGHSLTAKRLGVLTKKIVLLPMGGVALLENNSMSPRKDLWISLAGPMINFALGILFIPLVFTFPEHVFNQMLSFLAHPQYPLILFNQLSSFQWFVFLFIIVNFSIGLFNLIPALPLDGGRVLKAMLAFRLDEVKAVTYAVWIGNTLSLTVLLFGYWQGSFFLMLLGAYVLISSFGVIKRVKVVEQLKEIPVRELIISSDSFLRINGEDPEEGVWDFNQNDNQIPATTSLNDAIDFMLKKELQFLPVLEQGEVSGIISLKIIDDYIRTL